MASPSISKSQYIKGLKCPKALWLYSKGYKEKISTEKQEIFEAGKKIGKLAQECFQNGIEVKNKYYDIDGCVQATKAFIQQGYTEVFEATAINPNNGCYSRIDILSKVGNTGEWDMIEVKNSTKVKEYHYDDMAFQYHVFTAAGYNIRKCEMMLINNSYVKQGEIEVNKLFKREDISAKVFEKQDSIEEKIKEMIAIKSSNSDPLNNIGRHCMSPYECEYKAHCWMNVPSYSVYDIFTKKDEVDAIANKYGIKIEDIPKECFPEKKLIEVESYLSEQENVEIDSISDFLLGLEYPLYFLDYETVAPIIPRFDGTRPYQKIPFQFSLHRQDKLDGELHHTGYLHKDKSDSRLDFVKNLIAKCGKKGSVVVYNKQFEASINNALSEDFPDYATDINNITNRMVDLLIPFSKRWLYNPAQNGSASIKSVLPAFTDLNYDNMGVTSGGDAMRSYEAFINGNIVDDDIEKLWEELESYCKLDTIAMVELLKVLRSHTKNL